MTSGNTTEDESADDAEEEEEESAEKHNKHDKKHDKVTHIYMMSFTVFTIKLHAVSRILVSSETGVFAANRSTPQTTACKIRYVASGCGITGGTHTLFSPRLHERPW